MKQKGTKHYELTTADIIEQVVASDGSYYRAAQSFDGDASNFRRLAKLRGITRSRLPDGTLVIEHRKGNTRAH